MSLKKLELFGFKSFSDRTEIVFETGVTCVVGPNGCGKSNISDSIRWVLGERSAKLLRGSKMEDVIFSGTDYRKPIGFAEVHLTIDNSKKTLPIEYDEVVISRKIYRSGESEYYINKTLCRFKDIQDLILDTGIGSNSYSMIEQGRIDYILQADPDERRFLIEEAAGISKFKSKKEEALKKLERTEENLLRLGDIISEVEKNIKYAERQAKRAEKYKEQFEILKQLEIKKAVWQLTDLSSQKKDLEEKKFRLMSEQNTLQKDFSESEMGLKEIQSKIQNLESDLSFGELKKIELVSKINSLRDKIYFNVERIGSLKNQCLESENEIASGQERVRQLQTEIDNTEKEISGKETELKDRESNLKDIQGFLKIEREKLSSFKNGVEDFRIKQLSLGKDRAEHHNEKVRLESRISATKALTEQKIHESQGLQHEKNNVETQISRIKEKRIHLLEQQSVLDETLGVVEENLRIKETEIESVLSRMMKAEGRRKELQAHIDMLSGRGHSSGLNDWLQLLKEKRQDSASKIFNNVKLLKELVKSKTGFEGIYQKLMSVFSEDTLVMNAGDVFAEVKALISKSTASSVFSILCKSGTSKHAVPIEWKGLQLIPITEQIELIGDRNALQQIFISSKSALELFALGIEELSQGIQILTDDGILIGPGPFVTFPKGAEKNFISNKLSEITPEKELLVHQLAEYEDRVKRLKLERETMNQDKTKVQKDLEKIRTELESESKLASSLSENMLRIERKIQLLNTELESSHQEIANFEKHLLEHSRKTREMDGQEKSTQESLALLVNNEKEQSEIVESEKMKEVRLETEVISLRERLGLLTANLKQSQNAILTETSRIEQKRKNIIDGESQIKNLNEDNNSYSSDIDVLTKEQSEIEIRLSQVKENLDAERSRSEGVYSRVNGMRENLEKIREEVHQIEYRSMESNYARTSVLDRIRQTYKIDLEKETPSVSFAEGENAEEISLQITGLREKLESYGAVNILAVEEYNELKSRFDFLVNQRTDLVNARNALLDAIRKINRTTKKLFEETFKQVQIYFQDFFNTLFNGGHAQLALLDEENPLESGIEIMARPPGKKLQQISLLSGGEKALTAIALLFSLFKIKPSPFCVLDEVDAPLDEANIDRFLTVLRSFLESTQFIIITHNRKTISMGDALYGVTMEETGVSKIVSVRVTQSDKSGALLKSIEIEK